MYKILAIDFLNQNYCHITQRHCCIIATSTTNNHIYERNMMFTDQRRQQTANEFRNKATEKCIWSKIQRRIITSL